MPTKTSRKRLAQAAQKILSRPVPENVTKAALARFRATGLLPEDQRLGAAVLSSIRSGVEVFRFRNGDVDWGATIASGFERERRGKDEYMDGLIQEALFAKGMVKAAARQALVALASASFDVTAALFAGRELPEFGSVGFELLGLPERLARRPYVRQMRHLMQRLAALRRNLREHDRRWGDDLGRAVECFQLHGERPQDSQMFEAVLILGECNAFVRNACGEDVRDLLRLYESIATTDGDVRARHIAQLVEMAQDGMFRAEEE
ncbi:MAG: hypothetical protein R3F29_03570 [Planctomycetota bacterium]